MGLFLNIKTLDDLAIYFGYPTYEDLKSLLYPRLSYTSFELRKKSGGTRRIYAPGRKLKELQRKIADEVLDIFGQRSGVAHSFKLGRSIVTNALPHVGRAAVVRVDLLDFFGHINFGRVSAVFRWKPFRFAPEVASVLAHICCYENKLTQGAPSSAALTNFICLSLDKNLARLAKRYKARYTRYADDLTFSFKHLPLEKVAKDFITVSKNESGHTVVAAGSVLVSAIENEGFKVNESKTTGANKDRRQLVTGLVVNRYLTVPRKYTDSLRRALHIWDKDGLAEAEKRCVPVLRNRIYASSAAPSFVSLLRGKLTYLAMVKGKSDLTYLKFAMQFNGLVERDAATVKSVPLKVDPKVQGIQDAINATWYLTNGDFFEGTAFRFEGGIWVTCAHCIGDLVSRKLYEDVTLSSGDWSIKDLKVRVASIDWDRDIATLRPLPLNPIPRYLAYFRSAAGLPDQDARVGTIGFPAARLQQPPIFMRARVLRCRTKKGVSRIEIDKQILKGNSGGPLFDENYNVIGIVVEGAAVIVKEDTWDYGENACVAIGELANLK